jgi:hypothetical protein
MWKRFFKRGNSSKKSDKTTSDGYTPQPANMDLIRMVQTARMAHDDQAQPSQLTMNYWVEAKRNAELDAPAPTSRAGEFRITTDVKHMDALWGAIQRATQEGKLGYKSKVSTQPAFGQSERTARIIVVRTYDADDTADVERVRGVLVGILQQQGQIANSLPYIRL